MTTPFNFLAKRIRVFSHLDPERDWIVIMILSTIIFIIIVVWNAWAFDTVAGGGVIGSATANTPPVFSQTSLDTIHTIFADRAAEEGKYVSNVYHYIDPSL